LSPNLNPLMAIDSIALKAAGNAQSHRWRATGVDIEIFQLERIGSRLFQTVE